MEIVITILLLVGGAFTMSMQNAFKRGFTKSCPLFFAFCSTFFALLVFVVFSGFKFSFDTGLLKYSILMGVAYAICMVTLTLALKLGNLSLSGLIISASLIMPTLYGIIFLHNSVSVCFVIGLVVLIVALVLINLGGKSKNNVEQSERDLITDQVSESKSENTKGKTFRWLVFIIIAAVTNGLTSIIQTAQQTAYNGGKKNEFMIIALGIAGITILIAAIILERKYIKDGLKQSIILGGGSGIMNGLLNLFVMYSVLRVPAAVVFPVISGAGIVFTFLIAVIAFKERYTKIQYFGYFIGIVSVVLLNL